MLASEVPPKRKPENSNLGPCKSAGAQNCSCPQGQPHLLARDPVLPHSLLSTGQRLGTFPKRGLEGCSFQRSQLAPHTASHGHTEAQWGHLWCLYSPHIPGQLGREQPLSRSAAPLRFGFIFPPASLIVFPTGAGQAVRGRLRGRGCVQLLQELLQCLGHLHQQRLLGLIGTGGQRRGQNVCTEEPVYVKFGQKGCNSCSSATPASRTASFLRCTIH